MDRRLELDAIFRRILRNNNTYYNPPSNTKMKYDCIRYRLSNIDQKHADNKTYVMTNGYEVTYMSLDPESDVPAKLINEFEMIRFDRSYCTDNISHWVFIIYY